MGETLLDLREIQEVGASTRESIVTADACPALREHGLAFVGRSEAGAAFRFVRHAPAFAAVLVCVGGRGEAWAGGAWRPLGENEAYLAPAGRPHAYRGAEGAGWALCWAVYEVGRRAPTQGLPGAGLAAVDAGPLDLAVSGLYRELRGRAEASALHLWSGLVALHFGRASRGAAGERRLERVWRGVDADLARPWTLEDLAGLANLSGEQFRLLCHREVGRSPMRHVAHLRMGRATHLLSTTDWSVGAVARAVGYDNAFAFSTAFRRWAGLTPSQYRTAGTRVPHNAAEF